MNKTRDDQRDWHEQRIEKARAAANKTPGKEAAAKNWSSQNEAQRPAVQKEEERTVQQSKSEAGAPENKGSKETFSKRTKRPKQAGLGNESRPGLGTRADDSGGTPKNTPSPGDTDESEKPRADPKAYRPPRPEAREQAPDSLAHEQERSTGVSGHTSSS